MATKKEIKFKKGDRVSVIEEGVQYFGEIKMAGKEMCDINFDDGEEGTYEYNELVEYQPSEAAITQIRKRKRGVIPVERKGNTINLVSKIPKRNTFLSDSVRDERDAEVLRAEAGKREHKGKLKTITTVKHMEVSEDGFWVTEFAIELKE